MVEGGTRLSAIEAMVGLRSRQMSGKPFHGHGKIMVRLPMIMQSRAKAGIFQGGHAVVHSKPARDAHDNGKESIITPMVLVRFFLLFVI